jgi:hypothetical protein
MVTTMTTSAACSSRLWIDTCSRSADSSSDKASHRGLLGDRMGDAPAPNF